MPTERSSAIVDWVEFGKWVADMQDQLDISDRELGRRSGISATHIGMVKKGTTGLGDKKFTALVHALGTTEAIAKRSMQLTRPDLTPEEREVLQVMNRIPPARRSEAVGLFKAHAQILSGGG